MSDPIVSVPTVQTSNAESLAQALASAPWWSASSEEQRRIILADAELTVGAGLPLAEYVAGLADHLDAAGFIADAKLVEKPVVETPAEQPAEPTEEAKAQAQQEASRKLQAVVREYAKGQKATARHHVEAGRLASEYVTYRVVTLGHDRAAAIRSIAGRLSDVACNSVDPNALIAVYQATRLLGEGVDYGRVPYSALECYSLLVERDRNAEEWKIVAGVEEQARMLFREASTSEPPMPVRTLTARIRELDAQAKALRAAELAKLAADPKAGKRARDEAAKAQVAADKAAEKVTQQSSDKADKPAGADKPKAQEPDECRAEPSRLRDMGKIGTVPDVADMALELVESNDEPDSVVEHLLRLLRDSKHTSKPTKRALNAALVLLNRDERPAVSPIQAAAALERKPEVNGVAAVA